MEFFQCSRLLPVVPKRICFHRNYFCVFGWISEDIFCEYFLRRETTPSSNSRENSGTRGTQGGFTTSCSVHSGENDMIPRTMRLPDAPTSQEMEDFFAAAEAREKKRFTER